jgi:hypothetical protein
MKLAENLVAQGKLDEDILYLSLSMDNWKSGFCLMRMSLTKKKKEEAAKMQLQHEMTMEEKQEDLKIAQALQKAKADGKDQNQMTQGKIQAMLDEQLNKLKAETQSQIKEQMKNNRIEENNNKAKNERANKTSEALQPEPV